MRHFILCALGLSSGLALSGCVDRYVPDVSPAEQANLVVDGFINPLGRTTIKLARTFSVNTKSTAPAETRAQVLIQDEAGARYPLAESPAGTYTSASLALDPAHQYQLRLTTAQGREYASDLMPAFLTPPIDTLTWELTNVQGVQVYLSTHAASSAARYYRWEYEETYQFTSVYQSSVEYVASTNTVVERPANRQIFTCWRTEPSTAILLGTTAQLSQNTLTTTPLLAVLPSQKLRLGYSLLVRQYAQSPAEYAYWELLRKNTENLGTVNDPLPARVTGNVHALADATEPVLGFVGVHSVAERRLFISGAQFPTPRPGSVFYNPFYAYCEPAVPISLRNPYYMQQLQGGFLLPLIIDNVLHASTPACVDCRQYGTNIKPSYWP